MDDVFDRFRFSPTQVKRPRLVDTTTFRACVIDWLRGCDETHVLVSAIETCDNTTRLRCALIDSVGTIYKTCYADLCEQYKVTGLPRVDEIGFIVELFVHASKKGIFLIAHNVAEHFEIVRAAAEKVGVILPIESLHTICTMRGSRLFCGMTYKSGKIMPTSISELYAFLMDSKEKADAHEDLISVIVYSFVEGRIRGWW